MPDGTVHDGWLTFSDRASDKAGTNIEIFTGTEKDSSALNPLTQVMQSVLVRYETPVLHKVFIDSQNPGGEVWPGENYSFPITRIS